MVRPVPHGSGGWVWAGRVVAVLVLAGLGVYLARVGLDTADKLASSIGVLVAVATLLAPYLLPAPSSGSPVSEPDRVEDPGAATATADGEPNPGVQTTTDAGPAPVGRIPGLATAFQPRPGLRDRITAARSGTGGDSGSAGVVLTQAVSSSAPSAPSPGSRVPATSGGPAGVLSGGGGVGKSQLAAWFADRAVRDRTDLVVWVDASAPAGWSPPMPRPLPGCRPRE